MDYDNVLQVGIPKYMVKSACKGGELVIKSVEIDFEEDGYDHLPRNDRAFFIVPVVRYQDTYVKDNCEVLRFSGKLFAFQLVLDLMVKLLRFDSSESTSTT